MRSVLVFVGLVFFASGCSQQPEPAKKADEAAMQRYPETRRVDTTDTYHGTKVADPYRWLEADVRESPEVAEWVKKQNEVAQAYLDAIPQRPQIERRLTELWNYARYSAPVEEAGKYFYLKNDGLQDQAVLYVADKYVGEGRVLLDPNEWSKDGTMALADFAPSPDGKLLAYARSEAGSDWQQIFLVDVETGKERSDQLKFARFSDIKWDRSGSGFYYSRYPEPAPGAQYQSVATNQMLYFHKLGDEQSADALVYRRQDNPDWSFGLTPTDDGKYLVLGIYRSTDPQNQVLVRETSAAANAKWTELIADFENEFSFVGNDGSKLYFITDLAAPTKRIVTMDVAKPGRENVAEIVPTGVGTIDSASILAGRLIVQSLVDVLPHVRLFDLQGKQLGEVKLPGIGTVAGFGGLQENTETFYIFTSYNTPTDVYRYDVPANKSELVRRPEVPFNPDDFVVEQVFYKSKDGTRVPMMLAYKTRAERAERAGSRAPERSDGRTPSGDPTPEQTPPAEPRPTLLYGYGGYSITISPSFSADYIAWMELGGVVAVANLRGGGEYGEDWHLDGKNLKKQNVFDDFIAAAEWLIAEDRTTSDQLAILGGSNGGLLVGAVEVQRPELFGACIPIVGVLDMLRFHQFTAGQFWRDEYGSVDDPAEFKNLLGYSPYHNIQDGVQYPATLIMTADTDDRVVPMHSFKFAAALERAQAGDAPILLRVESRAGHGAGTPTSKRIENAADRWAFLVKSLKMDVPVD
ncbi:MAG: prolyl oligopeptidase family serine peptidase [Pirellulales bacterium]